MKFTRNLPVWLIGTTIALTQPHIAIAISPSQISSNAKEFTVLISRDGAGSGVIFERKGNTYYVLTNRHVVASDGRYEIQTTDGSMYPVYRSQEIPGLDLAVLEFTSNKNYKLATIGNSDRIQEGMPIYVVGWADAIPGVTRDRS
jgi:S1-C subfamily serine protease